MATVLFPNTFIFSSVETFALQSKQTSEVKMFFGASMVLIAHCKQIQDSKITTGSRGIARVCKYHILSMNFNGQKQNKSFDVTEINLWLEFADVIFDVTSDSRKYICVRRLENGNLRINSEFVKSTGVRAVRYDYLCLWMSSAVTFIVNCSHIYL